MRVRGPYPQPFAPLGVEWGSRESAGTAAGAGGGAASGAGHVVPGPARRRSEACGSVSAILGVQGFGLGRVGRPWGRGWRGGRVARQASRSVGVSVQVGGEARGFPGRGAAGTDGASAGACGELGA